MLRILKYSYFLSKYLRVLTICLKEMLEMIEHLFFKFEFTLN